MDQIKRAIERAKASGVAAAMEDQRKTELRPAATIEVPRAPVAASQTLHVSQKQLELSRIVSHLPGGGTSVGFDLLRTRVLQYMWGKGLTTLAVTSPTPACGKTSSSCKGSMPTITAVPPRRTMPHACCAVFIRPMASNA